MPFFDVIVGMNWDRVGAEIVVLLAGLVAYIAFDVWSNKRNRKR